MKTFATITSKSDVDVSEDLVDEIVHCWLLEFTALTRLARELGGSLKLLAQEIVNVLNYV